MRGRATRAEFWSFVIFFYASYLIVIPLAVPVGNFFGLEEDRVIGGAVLIVTVALLPALFCVLVRRLHDCGRGALSLCLLFIPYIGVFMILGLCFLESNPYDNQYGPHPKSRKPLTPDAYAETNVFT